MLPLRLRLLRAEGVQSLAGQWRFSLDRDDVGVKESWFAHNLAATTRISLPGILQTQGYGDDITAETQFIAALPRDMAWYKLPQYAAYTKPGHVEVPYLSQPVKHYLGVAWYQRDIEVPPAWKAKRVGLTLERTRWVTTVYVDDKELGTNRSLVAPHDCDLGIPAPGKHRLSIRIDNRMQQPPYRFDGHSVSDAEGATWNGIVGRIELAATSPVWIDDAQVFPNVEKKSARIKVRIGNVTGNAGSGTLSVGTTKVPVTWDASGGDAAIDVALPDCDSLERVHSGAAAFDGEAERTVGGRPARGRLRPARDQVGRQAHPAERRAVQLPRDARWRRISADGVSGDRCGDVEANHYDVQDVGAEWNPVPLVVSSGGGVYGRR